MGRRSILISEPYQSSGAGKKIPIGLEFLNSAREMEAPVLVGMWIKCVATFTTGADGARGGVLYQILDQIYLKDALAGERVNLRGSSARVIMQNEYGDTFADPPAINGGEVVPVTRTLWFRVPFRPLKCRRRADFGFPLHEVVDGGKLSVTPGPAILGGAAGATVVSAEFTVYIDVVDEGVRELKSRATWLDLAITKKEDSYPVGGFPRTFFLYNGEENEQTATGWPDGMTVESKTIDMQPIDIEFLQESYLLEHRRTQGDPGLPGAPSAFVNTDTVVTKQAVPVIFPTLDQKLITLQEMATMHIKLSATPNAADNPQVIVCVVTDRNPRASMRTLRTTNLDAAIEASGRTKLANGNQKPLDSLPQPFAKIMPLKVSRGKGKRGPQ